MSSLIELCTLLGQQLAARSWYLATAESCTGGAVSAAITDISGSSGWFDRGFVTYSNDAKMECLEVPEQIINELGAVSESTAIAMSEGALKHSRANISVSLTGIAGPDGGTPEKPVGTLWIAWAGDTLPTQAECFHFDGDRYQVRRQATMAAIMGLIELTRP